MATTIKDSNKLNPDRSDTRSERTLVVIKLHKHSAKQTRSQTERTLLPGGRSMIRKRNRPRRTGAC